MKYKTLKKKNSNYLEATCASVVFSCMVLCCITQFVAVVVFVVYQFLDVVRTSVCLFVCFCYCSNLSFLLLIYVSQYIVADVVVRISVSCLFLVMCI